MRAPAGDAYLDDHLLDMSRPRDPPVEGKYRLTPWRWFILFYFSVSNCNQCLAWFSFSSTEYVPQVQTTGFANQRSLVC